ncbi:MAG: TRAP transporter small permease subunit [Pseudomonadales bacterium]|nr:TRAP transporter small permease subunit [Pseudomonadales bacterium]NRA13894.1 TRAP transporter small permease subunit [Oceanospirillaceae bacterium]
MPNFIRSYVKWVEKINRVVGRFAMYMVLAMIGVLLYATLSRGVFNLPVIWAVELAQFIMAAYYLLGGGYSLQNRAHVRMDVFYSNWSMTTRAKVDVATSLFLIFYMLVLLHGGWGSTEYAIKYDTHKNSSWGPPMAPIKVIMTTGIFLMLLQVFATFFRDIATARGEDIS